jgi:hypothetical protein|tara:strand:- start:119 stop:229 length:111 start_codon:yes stop_codon:yes gene_type:complete
MYPKNPVIPKITIIVMTGNLVAADEKKLVNNLMIVS